MGLTKLGLYIEQSDFRNADSLYGADSVVGLSTQKQIINTKADLAGVNLSSYKLMPPKAFAYVPDTSRRGDKVSLAYNTSNETYLVSSISVVFFVRDNSDLLPDYLYMYFNRPEFDRYARYNSWGSARETFSWEEMCDIDIDLPDIAIQQKYVDIYNAMLENQRCYESALEDLKLVCDAYIEELNKDYQSVTIGQFIFQRDLRNDGSLGVSSVRGISTGKEFINTKADMEGVGLNNYKVVAPGQFAYVPDTSRRGDKISLALNASENTYLVSSISIVFDTQKDVLLPEYLMLFFGRSEFDRYARFHSWGSARETFDWSVQSRKDTETRFMGLSRRLKSAYNICFPSGELTDEETAKAQFYLAIRSIIYKQTKGNAPDAEAMNQVVENMVREAIACTGIENVVDEHKSVDLFSDEFIEQLNTVKLPITKFNALLKLLRKAISAYGRTNKVKAMEFDERLRKVVDDYNSRDKLVFTNEVVSDFVNDLSDQLLQILRDLQEDQSSFQKMGISFEEKAFYDILVKVRDDHGFPYADEKCVVLAKKIKELVDDKAQFADWSTRDDIKNQLNMELTVLLYQNGYPPEWDEEVFEKVMEQAENFKKYAD